MGYETRTINVIASVSRHNDERDQRDDDLVLILKKAIEELASSAMFLPLGVYVEL